MLREKEWGLRILFALRWLMRAADIDSRKLVSSHQATGLQLMCLIAVAEKGPITATEIAQYVHVSPSTLVGVLDRLEGKGLIRRERNREDRRQVRISASALGEELAARSPYPLQYSLTRALEQMPKDEQMSTALSLERLVNLMEQEGSQAGSVRPDSTDATSPGGE